MITAAIQSSVFMAATRHGLDPAVVVGVVAVESGGNPWAWNPEPQYRYLWDVKSAKPFRPMTPEESAQERPPYDFRCLAGDPDQEWWGQQASWGLMQVMGAVARERGFAGPYLSELCNAAIGLEFGCRHLAALLAWASGDVERALAAYNGGFWQNVERPYRSAAYAAKVFAARPPGGPIRA